ncbi:Lipl32 family lipoprotein [Abyssalbus ytuae]|uniref:Lipl32 family lipoprotein n=1 Tax=Abyssalbus ytuae TaxID=2926907 RepID=A0A9E7A2D8_9FLAO|nr:Lipl32 family lipoprotein [Abyssalbus ytuae]UOB18516.1 Lipl32 family lipoprotein [Abyssalbus ytuae]
MKNLISFCIVALISFTGLNAQKLGKFGSSSEKKIGPKTIRVPYTDVISYKGFASPGNEDEIKDGKKFYYIYVWIPLAAPELGVRMMSPVGKVKIKNAIESKAYTENAGSSDYFDTYITLERSDIIKKENISQEGVKNATWVTLKYNDDSSEMPALPNGSKYNSLLRYTSDINNPTKALTAGLYRIGFTTYKVGEVKGTFLAEVGAPVKLPGVAMAKTIEKLKESL